MENFFDVKRRAARLVRPVATKLGAGRLVAPDSVFEALERLYHEIEDVRQILLDETRTSARLVVNPARVVVDETRRSFAYLSLYGVATDAVLVNPFDVEELANGLHAALTMPAEEQERRMRRMRAQVTDHNIYRWAGQLLSAVGKLVPEPQGQLVGAGISASDPIDQQIARENFVTAMRIAGG